MEYIYLLIKLLFLTQVRLIWAEAGPPSGTQDVYLSTKDGEDKSNCGGKSNPCQTLAFAWSIFKSRRERIQLILDPGVYSSPTVVDFNCDSSSKAITIKRNIPSSGIVQIWNNFLLTGCNLTLVDVFIGDPLHGVQHMYYYSTVVLKNLSIENTKINIFGQESSILIQNSSISNCSSTHADLPIFVLMSFYSHSKEFIAENFLFYNNSVGFIRIENLKLVSLRNVKLIGSYLQPAKKTRSTKALQIQGVKTLLFEDGQFINNANFGVEISEVTSSHMENIMVKGNIGLNESSLFTFLSGNYDMLSSHFAENVVVGKVLEVNGNANFSCSECNFVCNQINGSQERSPITFSTDVKVNITSSKASKCPVICKGGHLLKSNLLCLPCLKGEYLKRSNVSKVTCERCPVGMYTREEGSVACKPCARGSYCGSKGCVTCQKCRNDFFKSKEQASSCSEPTVLFVTLVAITGCLILLPGFILIGKRRKVKNVPSLRKCSSPCTNVEKQSDKKALIINS